LHAAQQSSYCHVIGNDAGVGGVPDMESDAGGPRDLLICGAT
jgi:hypothetical protein